MLDQKHQPSGNPDLLHRTHKRAILAMTIGVSSCFLFLLLTTCQIITEISLSFSQSEIEEWIKKAFPIQKQEKFYTLVLQNPTISLQEGSDRIGIQFSVEGSILKTPILSAKVWIEGQLLYKSEKKTLYLTNFVIRDLSISAMTDIERSVRTILAETQVMSILQQELKEIPLYKLDSSSSIYSKLKQVSIKNGRLVVIMSLGPVKE